MSLSPDTARSPHPQPSAVRPVPLSRRSLLALAALTAGTLAACGKSPSTATLGGEVLSGSQARQAVALSHAPDLRNAVVACDALGDALLSAQLADGTHGNALASPASLGLSLATVSLGATDPQEQGLTALLGCQDEDSRNTTWSALQTALLAYDGDPADFDPEAEPPETPLLHVAHQLLIIEREDAPAISQEFVDSVCRWFAADLRRARAKEAQEILDGWVRLHTGGLIKESALQDPATTVALQNVVLFAARWQEMFEEDSSYDQDFTLAEGTVTQVPMMHRSGQMICVEGSTDGADWKALRVPYSEGFALDLILPSLGTLPEYLPPGTWAQATALLDEAKSEGISSTVTLALPRIDLATPEDGVDLMPLFESLGADIRPMGRIGPSYETSEYRQQVRLLIEEDGTKAAAVSEHGVAVSAIPGGSQETSFIVDHPYALRLRDLSTGLSVFEAVVNDPRG